MESKSIDSALPGARVFVCMCALSPNHPSMQCSCPESQLSGEAGSMCETDWSAEALWLTRWGGGFRVEQQSPELLPTPPRENGREKAVETKQIGGEQEGCSVNNRDKDTNRSSELHRASEVQDWNGAIEWNQVGGITYHRELGP